MLKPAVAMSMIDVFQLQRSYKNMFCMQVICTAQFYMYRGSSPYANLITAIFQNIPEIFG